MEINNYVTFNCGKYLLIERENHYCLQEDLFGNYLADELDKRCNYVTQTYFVDFGFEIYLKISGRSFYALITVIDDAEFIFGISIRSTLISFERFIGREDFIEHNQINKLIEDILQLDNLISNINWLFLHKNQLNIYVGQT